MMTKALTGLALAGLFATGWTAAAWAAGDVDRETAALGGAKIALTQAIATAEEQTNGRAYDAGVDVEHGVTRFKVETAGPRGVQTVTVNAQDGAVIAIHAGGEAD